MLTRSPGLGSGCLLPLEMSRNSEQFEKKKQRKGAIGVIFILNHQHRCSLGFKAGVRWRLLPSQISCTGISVCSPHGHTCPLEASAFSPWSLAIAWSLFWGVVLSSVGDQCAATAHGDRWCLGELLGAFASDPSFHD